tara:strand:- start:1774 stop:2289 length:516 start_codon:yes stop_codon:yes gene_type:complete
MAFLDEEFNLDDMPASGGSDGDFQPIPAGWYTAKIAGAEIKDTKAGTGKYISLRLDITGPTHEGRVVFTNLNTRNPNPKAEEIARQQLGDIMRSIGLPKLKDTDQLIGGDLSIKVTVKNDATYGAGNEVKGFKALEGAASMPPKAKSEEVEDDIPFSKPASEDSSSPPWAK